MAAVVPFKIAVPNEAIKRLHEKLALATFADDTEFADDWSYGIATSDLKRLAARWKDGFDWRAQEAKLNEMPQFTTDVDIDGFGKLNIHLVHRRSSQKDAIPLLFIHGWPGCFYEVLKILPLLTEPAEPQSQAFHVVAPSLPNFGFSDRVTKKGFSIPQYAESMHKTMLNLGYDRYAQGGDWGFCISRCISSEYPSHCLANHINMMVVTNPPSWSHFPLLFAQTAIMGLTAQEKVGINRTNTFATDGCGYFEEQSSKPNTIGAALADSPVALLAWLYEKLHDWTDTYHWEDDEALTWISIYAFSKPGPDASVRIYYECKHAELPRIDKAMGYVPNVKLGVSIFPNDLMVMPIRLASMLGPVAFAKVHEDGGHFAAHERPERLVQDLQEMFGKNGGARNIVRLLQGN